MYFLGAITAASGAYNNWATGASGIGAFSIPPSTKSLYLVPAQSGILFEFGGTTGFQTTAVRGAQLMHSHAAGGFQEINGPFRCIGPTITVSIYNSAGGFVSVQVYASPTS